MTQEHPITPSPELVKQWLKECTLLESQPLAHTYLATRAAQWGADQELEACCEWLKTKHWIEPEFPDELHVVRRPKPPSLKELALGSLQILMKGYYGDPAHADLIRRALEQLDD